MRPRSDLAPRAVLLFLGLLALLAPGCGSGADAPEAGASAAAGGEGAGLEGEGAARPERVEAQLALFWGGGGMRDWIGELRVVPPEGGEPQLDWAWLSDFEEGDRIVPGRGFPALVQRVPPGWTPSDPAAFVQRPSFPPGGASFETTTAGDADGVYLGFRGDPASTVEIDAGPEARLRTTVAELLRGPVVVAEDADGGRVLAAAVDLGSEAPVSVPHFEGTAYRASLHTHSCFSTNEFLLEPVIESLRPFVRTVWWTDHNTADDRLILAGDFEDSTLTRVVWQLKTRAAQVVDVGFDADVPPESRGTHSLRLAARYAPEERAPGADGPAPGGEAWFALQNGRGAGEQNVALPMRPVLRWSWKPLPGPDGEGAAAGVAFVRVQFHSGPVIRYLSAPAAPAGDAVDVVLPTEPGVWSTVELDLANESVHRLGERGTDGFRRVSFGVVCPPGPADAGDAGGALFDDLELQVPPPAELVRIEERTMQAFPGLRSFVGLEQSAWLGPEGFGALQPHLVALAPKPSAALFGGYDAEPTAADRAAFVRRFQAAGGCVGAHHLQLLEHYEPFVEARGYGANLFELGDAWHRVPWYATNAERRDRDAHRYPPLTEDELFPLLVRWDRLTARGLLLTGYGAPDLHQRFDRPNDGWMNRWLTSIHAADGDPASLLTALRCGQATAVESRSRAELTLAVEGRPWMGKLVATDRARHIVTARVSGALPGSRLRWIQGTLVRNATESPVGSGGEPEPARAVAEVELDGEQLEARIEVGTGRGAFVRAELYDPVGRPVALSNPVTFVPYWPSDWPDAKAAFDWRELSLAEQPGIALTELRVTNGGLVLRGLASGATRSLALRGPGVATIVAVVALGERAGAQRWTETRDEEALLLTEIPPGPFALGLRFEEPWPEPPSGNVLALPRRKELVSSIDVGIPASEDGRLLTGFSAPYLGPLGLVHHRGVLRPEATFRLALPANEQAWIRLVTHGFSRATGQLSVDGEPLGRLERMGERTFAVAPPAGGEDGGSAGDDAGARVERTFTLTLDPVDPALGPDVLLLKRLEVWRGAGAIDY